MLTKVSVGLNGILLTDIDSSIVLQSVEESAPSWNPTASARAHLLGQHYLTTEKRFKDVTVNFALAIRDDFAHRTEVMDRIAAWAATGGKLTLNYRNDQELRVKCITLPALTDVLKWANPYRIVFRAYDIPQWISTFPSTVSFTSALATRTLYVRGTAGGKLCVAAANHSGSTCTWIAFSVSDSQRIQLAGFELLDGETFVMDYTDNDIQRIWIQPASGPYRSILDKRSETSVDDIWVGEGPTDVSVSASCSLDWTLYTYGRWTL